MWRWRRWRGRLGLRDWSSERERSWRRMRRGRGCSRWWCRRRVICVWLPMLELPRSCWIWLRRYGNSGIQSLSFLFFLLHFSRENLVFVGIGNSKQNCFIKKKNSYWVGFGWEGMGILDLKFSVLFFSYFHGKIYFFLAKWNSRQTVKVYLKLFSFPTFMTRMVFFFLFLFIFFFLFFFFFLNLRL